MAFSRTSVLLSAAPEAAFRRDVGCQFGILWTSSSYQRAMKAAAAIGHAARSGHAASSARSQQERFFSEFYSCYRSQYPSPRV